MSSIRQLFLKNMMFTAMASIVLLGIVWIQIEYAAFSADAEEIRQSFIASQKQTLQVEVARVVEYVQYMRNQTEKRLKKTIRTRVDEACRIAENIYLENQASQSIATIQKMITDALRPIRFNNDRGYYFAFSLNGIETLFADRPEMEGQNMLSLQGADGKFVVRDMIDIAREEGAGFYEYSWTKPGETGTGFRKIAYVKLFEPLNWIFGTGEYVDDARDEIQTEVLTRIVELRFGAEGYFFGSVFGGQPLFTNGQITRGTASIWGLTDPNGIKLTQAYNQAARELKGGFVRYAWPKLNADTPSPKISFVMAVPEWDWIIGAGVYLDTIDAEIAARKQALFDAFKQKALISFLTLGLILVMIYFWARKISDNINTGIHLFSSFFQRAATDNVLIEPDTLPFSEFRDIALAANSMLEDRLEAERVLKERETILNETGRMAKVGGWKHDLKTGQIVWTQSLYGVMEIEQLQPLHVDDQLRYFPSKDRRRLVHAYQVCKRGGQAFDLELQVDTANGRRLWCRVTGEAIFEGQTCVQMRGTFQDITERKQAEVDRQKIEMRLRQSRKLEAIGALAGGIAHDFNNMLSVVIGYAELSLEDVSMDSPVHAHLTEVLRAGMRARDLIKQILTFSRQDKPQLQPMVLNAAIADAVQMLRAAIPSSIDMAVDIGPQKLIIQGDATQIHQVLLNLITNAAHAMPDSGGQIDIGLEMVALDDDADIGLPPGKYAHIHISDNGSGIARADLEHIFDPYFTTKDVDQGSGLGLAVVHGIVKSHHGAIQVYSEHLQGSAFHIYFPLLSTDVETDRDIDVREDVPRGTERILLVDDEPTIIDVAKQSLLRLGYAVTACDGSQEALERFRAESESFDLVITDMTMPHMTGVQLAHALKTIRNDIPVILCTGFNYQINKPGAVISDVDAVCMKPVAKFKFAKTIRTVLDNATS